MTNMMILWICVLLFIAHTVQSESRRCYRCKTYADLACERPEKPPCIKFDTKELCQFTDPDRIAACVKELKRFSQQLNDIISRGQGSSDEICRLLEYCN
ncbi:hypothetical protein DdX_01815 [Ditylenchus destructor]|uniref:Saposin B-type domain-containing protein n=1 Tax=Ditylenchus destructor TaxID=166010 RepID=A0AAD4NG99_9BILA|nr:hypothetical protein DdX_01815 [Ditylenchus destructor]